MANFDLTKDQADAAFMAARKAAHLWGVDAEDAFQEALIYMSEESRQEKTFKHGTPKSRMAQTIYINALRDWAVKESHRGMTGLERDDGDNPIGARPSDFVDYDSLESYGGRE